METLYSPSICEDIEVDEFGRKFVHGQVFLFSVVLFIKLTHYICITTAETTLSLVPCQIMVDMQKNLKMHSFHVPFFVR